MATRLSAAAKRDAASWLSARGRRKLNLTSMASCRSENRPLDPFGQGNMGAVPDERCALPTSSVQLFVLSYIANCRRPLAFPEARCLAFCAVATDE